MQPPPETSNVKRSKNRYAELSAEQRNQYIENSQNARKRRTTSNICSPGVGRDNEVTNSNNNRRQKIDWLLRALLIPYNYQGQTLYNMNCSSLHELRKVRDCDKCGAKRFEYEPPTFCCYNGQIKLAAVEAPRELHELFTSQSEEAKEFRRHIRAYNSIFSFTSFGVNLDKELASKRRGVYTFRAQGQIYHDLPSLTPEQNNPCYFQLYFYDTNNELQNRLRILQDVNISENVVKKLMEVLEGNPYSQFLRRLKDLSSFENLEIRIVKDVKLDQRVYNSLSADQVAAIWVEGNNPNAPFDRDIIVHTHSGRRHRVKHYFGCYDPLQYPLLFPKGECGWQQNIKKRNVNDVTENGNDEIMVQEENISPTMPLTSVEDILQREQQDVGQECSGNVSCREYYSYKLQMRRSGQSSLLFAGRLLQQFAVDMYIKLETTRLDFYRRQQSKVRAELYQGIVDCVTAGETRGSQVGKRIVLPSSFIGGPRDMRRRYLDAMALVQRFGKPDLFITMTCNPDWKEIKNELEDGQLAQDRPDLTSRVFRAKLQDLKDQVFKKKIFGEVAAHVHVIEFQKRGLPHAHMLVILKPGFKINTPDEYDKFVCAEIPNENEDPQLYDMVLKHMMHGPCGELNKGNPCMVNGTCRNHYPRSFCSKTLQGKDSYPLYRRRNDGRQERVRNKMLDNRWVVPYNPYLLSRYNCHINVEICSGLKAVKYLYKYIYKGHDKVAVCVSYHDGENTIDEIQQFQDARWVSAQEAMWRIFEFNLNEIFPSVINLHLHLPNKQLVYYWENQNLDGVVHWDHASKTMLIEFFNTCSRDAKAREYLYREFPEHYVWNKQGKYWTKRKRGDVLGRVNGANPTEGERYYLRLLLNHIRGPTSFQDLLTFIRVQYLSFKESAHKRGLLETDESISNCMTEASAYQMPKALRRLFATILVYCEPADVRKLWEDHFEAMSEDFNRIDNVSIDNQISSTLKNINYFLESMGKHTREYDLPHINGSHVDDSHSYPREIRDELAVEIPLEDCSASSNLNPEQVIAYSIILDRVTSGRSGVFFIDGPEGTGKTYLYRALLANIRSRDMIALATATSGVAAAIMPGGRTAHSRFKIPIATTETSVCNIPKQSGTAKLIRKANTQSQAYHMG